MSDCREFVRTKAAFYVEHFWWPGEFDSDDERMDFELIDYDQPENYEVLEKWHDEAEEESFKYFIDLIVTRFSRNIRRASATALAIPYVILYFSWQ